MNKRYIARTIIKIGECRYCHQKVSPPRRTFCSSKCVHEYRLRTSSSYIRKCVYRRDHGICAICKINTRLIRDEILESDMNERLNIYKKYSIPITRKVKKRKNGGGLWDADHILPVKFGGGCCSLQNIQTLCIKCHKEKTKLFRNIYIL